MVSILPPISNLSSPFSKPLRTVPSAPITIGITVTQIFHSYFSSLSICPNFRVFFFLILWFCCAAIRNDTFVSQKCISLYSFEMSWIFVGVWETETETETKRRRQIQTATLIHNFLFFWPKHAALSSNSGRTSFPPLQDILNQSPPRFSICRLTAARMPYWLLNHSVGCCLIGVHSHSLALSVTDRISSGRKLRLALSHEGICIYHFTMPTISARSRDCFR